MGKTQDLTGKRNGKIKIISFLEKRGGQGLCWNYECDCGTKGVISSGDFKRNRRKDNGEKSCGCIKHSITDYTNHIYNNLTVLSYSHTHKGKSHWNCKCSCGNEKIICSESFNRNLTKSCGCLVKKKSIQLHLKTKERLLERIKINKDCWEWQGGKSCEGYGTCGIGYGAQTAHRASYLAFKGEIPKGLFICHHCDNKSCINPDHLYAGTAKDNSRDAVERGLQPRGPCPAKSRKGILNCHAKLDEEKIKYIRFICDNGFKKSEISKFFNVHYSTIKNIASRKTWKHV